MAAYSIGAVAVLAALVYAGSSEPRLTLVWALWEKLEVLPPQSFASTAQTRGWVRLGHYSSVAECSAKLRKIVREDERAGSTTVLDEKSGTMAITILITKKAAQNQSNAETNQEADSEMPGATDEEKSLLAPGGAATAAPDATKRVRNLECRATQRLEKDSLLRRALRKVGVPA